jgi:predicted dehydrogenase
MTADPLSAAVLGLGPAGQFLLEAAQQSGWFRIKAVGDPDRQRAEHTAARCACDSYTDYRQLIVQNQVDCLLVTADLHTCAEHLKAAIRKKFNIFKPAPAARTFTEALEYAEMAAIEKVRFFVANPARFRSSFRTARQWIAEGRISQVFLITGHLHSGAVDRTSWHSDPELAGGGVLLYDAHQMIDQVLWNFPVPQQVYALNGSQALDKQQRLYLTEDTSVVSLKFTDALTGSLIATRRPSVRSQPMQLTVHGRDCVLTVTDEQVLLTSLCDDTRQVECFQESERDIMIRLLTSFAQSLQVSSEKEEVSTISENLRNMAVIESAYLSARTGFPEEPSRVLQRAGNSPVGGLARI